MLGYELRSYTEHTGTPSAAALSRLLFSSVVRFSFAYLIPHRITIKIFERQRLCAGKLFESGNFSYGVHIHSWRRDTRRWRH